VSNQSEIIFFLLYLSLRSLTAHLYVNQNSNVKVNLYVVMGRLVQKLCDRQLAEQSSFSWDGADINGGKLAGGVYFVAVSIDDKVTYQKVTLVK
jgi:hypothetical protein